MYGYANPCAWHKNGVLMTLYKLFTWHCCNSSQAAGCRSWFVGVNLQSNSVLHNMWSVVCQVDLKRTKWGWRCDHRGCPCCDCRWFRCSNTCQEMINVHTQNQLDLANYPRHTKVSYEEWSLTLTRRSTRP